MAWTLGCLGNNEPIHWYKTKYFHWDTSLFCRRSREPSKNTRHSNNSSFRGSKFKGLCGRFAFKMHSFLFIHSKPQVGLFLGVFLLYSLSFSFANKVDGEESCRVYAGGQVYPQERKTSEHALHWSKAQSKRPLYGIITFTRRVL